MFYLFLSPKIVAKFLLTFSKQNAKVKNLAILRLNIVVFSLSTVYFIWKDTLMVVEWRRKNAAICVTSF